MPMLPALPERPTPSRGWAATRLRASLGFTATEMLVTLSILGTLSAMAAPSMTSALRRSMISASANDVLNAVNRARIEAQRSSGNGMPYTVCASSESATPSTAKCTGTWNQGLIVFADANGNGARDAGEAVVLALPAMDGSLAVSVKSTLPYVLFAPNGMLHGSEAGARFTFNHARYPLQSDVRHLCVLRAGLYVVRDGDLQADARYAQCKAL
jgi:prepilin-type N-terminal cleavage/methylation domain-containing protein